MYKRDVVPPAKKRKIVKEEVDGFNGYGESVFSKDPTAPGIEKMPVVPASLCEGQKYTYNFVQTGEVIAGPGASSNTVAAILVGNPPKLSSDQAEAVREAKKYAMEQNIRMFLMKQSIANQQQKNEISQRQQVKVLMCRIYVGSISFELKEDTIRRSFLPFGTIKSINMSWDPATQRHKGFAFVEYEIPEAAQLALEQMNGAVVGGRNIKVVGSPSNMPQAQHVIDQIQEEAKKYNIIYVASIHQDLGDDDIKSVFEAFGPIKYCKLAQESYGQKHKGYGFIEYGSAQAAYEAIASMNLFDLGGQYLRVGRVIIPPDALLRTSPGSSVLPTAVAMAAATATAKIQAMDAEARKTVALGLSSSSTAVAIPVVAPKVGFNFADRGYNPIAEPVPPGGVPAVLSPPGIVIPQITQNNTIEPAIGSPIMSNISQVIIPSPVMVAPAMNQTQTASFEAMKSDQETQLNHQEQLQKKLLDQNEPQTLEQQESMSIKGQNARHFIMQKLMRKVESRVVILKNMVGPEEVDESLHEEIQEECSKFGAVDRIICYKEKQTEEDDSDITVKIFVEFMESHGAEKTRAALDGRYFGGRVVGAALYDQALFDYGDYSG